MSLAELAAAFVTAFLALVAIVAYLVDAAGYGVVPSVALGVAAVLCVAAAFSCLRSRYFVPGTSDLLVWLGIVVFVTAALLPLSWPSLVPPGRGPDLTHHLLLVDYIEHNQHLVHDRSLDGAMGEMAHYTPGAHLLAVIAGASLGGDGLHAFFPIAVLSAALTAAFVFLIGRRHRLPLPYAVTGAALLLLPMQYFAGAFTHDSFLAQSVATLFAVATWWALAYWVDRPGLLNAAIVAIFLVAVFLSWPIWLGPLLLVFLAVALRATVSPRERQVYLAIVLLPFLAIAVLHSWDRWGWMMIVRTSGAVLQPSFDSLGWLLPLLAALGVFAAMYEPRTRITVALLVVIGVQMLTLFVLAGAQGADTPYMAFKMVYLAIYPMAVLGALGIARIAAAARSPQSAGWLVAAALLLGTVPPALNAPRPVAVVNDNLYAAGRWLRAHGFAACTDYLVADAETAYWLHLAVLGNPRATPRMQEVDRYDPRAALGPWITSEGRTYAIADLRVLPAEIRSRVDVAAQFGSAAVIKRRDATIEGCD